MRTATGGVGLILVGEEPSAFFGLKGSSLTSNANSTLNGSLEGFESLALAAAAAAILARIDDDDVFLLLTLLFFVTSALTSGFGSVWTCVLTSAWGSTFFCKLAGGLLSLAGVRLSFISDPTTNPKNINEINNPQESPPIPKRQLERIPAGGGDRRKGKRERREINDERCRNSYQLRWNRCTWASGC